MAQKEQVAIDVGGSASKFLSELDRVESRLKELGKESGGGSGMFDGMGNGLAGLAAKVGAVVGSFFALREAVKFSMEGFELNSQLESAQGSLATLMGMFGDDRGFSERLEVAAGVIDELREKGDAAETTFGGLVDTLTAVAGSAAAAGIGDFSDQIDMIIAASQALDVAGGDQANLSAELQRILTGTTQRGDRLNGLLQLTNEELRKAASEGTLLELVMGRMAPIIKDAEQGMGSWRSQMTFIQENWDKLRAAVMAPLFEPAKAALATINEYLSEAVTFAEEMGAVLGNAVGKGKVGELLTAALKLAAAEAANYLAGAFSGAIHVAVQAFGVLNKVEFWKGLLELFAGLGQVMIALGGLLLGSLTHAFSTAAGSFATDMVAGVLIYRTILMGALELVGVLLKDAMLEAADALLSKLEPVLKLAGLGGHIAGVRESIAGERTDLAKRQGELTTPGNYLEWAREDARKLLDFGESFGQEMINESKKKLKDGVDGIRDSMITLGPVLEGEAEKAKESFKKGMDVVGDMIDTDGLRSTLTGLYESLKTGDEEGKKGSKSGRRTLVATPSSEEDKKKKDSTDRLEATVDSMQAVGGGGGIFGTGLGLGAGAAGVIPTTPEETQETMLTELRTQTSLLTKIVDLLGSNTGALTISKA